MMFLRGGRASCAFRVSFLVTLLLVGLEMLFLVQNSGPMVDPINSPLWQQQKQTEVYLNSNNSAVIDGTEPAETTSRVSHDGGDISPIIAPIDPTNETKRALFAISMGKKAANSQLVERFVWSARNGGQYLGWIVILTDAPDGRYAGIHNWTDNVIFMRPESQDIKTHYKTCSMAFKRFKTMVLDYVDKDHRLANAELVYYLDIDIVFANDLMPMFNGLEETYGIGNRIVQDATDKRHQVRAKSKMWMFQGNLPWWPAQSGQIIFDRNQSKGCATAWRKLFDQKSATAQAKDQNLLNVILKRMKNASEYHDFSNLECEIGLMTQQPYIEFPKPGLIKNRNKQLAKGKLKSVRLTCLRRT